VNELQSTFVQVKPNPSVTKSPSTSAVPVPVRSASLLRERRKVLDRALTDVQLTRGAFSRQLGDRDGLNLREAHE
jgi:hypothetical protein